MNIKRYFFEHELSQITHKLFVNEYIHETFTTIKKKELSNFTDFRIIATSKKGYENSGRLCR